MSEAIVFNITIDAGEDYILEIEYEDNDNNVIDMRGWYVEAQLREFAEDCEAIDFVGIAGVSGVQLQLSHEQTEMIGYSHGKWDVFIIDPDHNTRVQMARGDAYIRRGSVR